MLTPASPLPWIVVIRVPDSTPSAGSGTVTPGLEDGH